MDQTALIESVVEEVVRRMGGGNGASASPVQVTSGQHYGLYDNVDAAVAAAQRAQHQLMDLGVDGRDKIVKLIKRIVRENAVPWGKVEFDETKIGRLDHKVVKLELLDPIPGVEFLESVAHSGDHGIAIDEFAPWGVIGVITPVTHSIPTVTANAINMIAAGNSMVVNAHPAGANCLAMALETYNRAIASEFGIEDLMCAIHPPTLRTAEEVFRHEDIPLLVATGGPGVARAAMKQTKRAIVAGPGNPPVVVDETADFDRAARSIIVGAAFDNNLLCIGEKEVFVVEQVFDQMMDAMQRAGAVCLNASQIDKLTAAAITKKDNGHFAVTKEFIGMDTDVLAQAAGMDIGPGVDLLYGETDEFNPFVPEEQMMPFVPFIRVPNFDKAVELAIKYEHGFGHTAIIHSNNLANITAMGQAVNTTIFVANGASTAALGGGGEGYASYSIATPTGEGVTNPLTFTRFRRTTIADALRVI